MEDWTELVLDVPEGGTETIDRSISDSYCAILNLAFESGYERSPKSISETVDTYFKLMQNFRDNAKEKQAILDMYLKGGERHEIMRDIVRIDVEHASDLGRTIYWKEQEKQKDAYTGVTIGSLRRYAAAIAAVVLLSVGALVWWVNSKISDFEAQTLKFQDGIDSTAKTLEDKFKAEAAAQRKLITKEVDERIKPLEEQAQGIADEIEGIKKTADEIREYAEQAAQDSKRMRTIGEELAKRFGIPIPKDDKDNKDDKNKR